MNVMFPYIEKASLYQSTN